MILNRFAIELTILALLSLATAAGCGQDALPAAPPATTPAVIATTSVLPASQPAVVIIPQSETAPMDTASSDPRSELETPVASAETPALDAAQTPRDVSWFSLFSAPVGAASGGDYDSPSVEDSLAMGLYAAGITPTRIAFRGTAGTDSVRCEWRGVARTAGQREASIRFWLGKDDDEPLSAVSEVEAEFMSYIEGVSPRYQNLLGASFLAIARGGLSTDRPVLTCYAEYAASEYLLGTGPSRVSVAYDRISESRSYDLYRSSHAAGEFGPATSTPLMSEAEYQAYLDRAVSEAESTLAEVLEGREAVVFLAPMGAHNAIAVEAWQAVAQWDVQRAEDGTLYAVRYGAREGDPEHTQTLANLKSRITAATTATSTTATSTAASTTATSTAASTTATSTAATTTRIATVSGLNQCYHNIGAADGMDGGYSDTITIIDNPILTGGRASGNSPGGSGQATLVWDRIPEATEYFVEYRKLSRRPSYEGVEGLPLTEENWPGALGWPYYEGDSTSPLNFSASSSDPVRQPVTGLELGELYAFQVNYNTNAGMVFSARDAYVWVSDELPTRTSRVGTYPFFGYWEGGRYDYTICSATFTPNDGSWQNLIVHAFEQWEQAVPHRLTVTRRPGSCTTDGQPIDNDVPIALIRALFNESNEVYMVNTAGWDTADWEHVVLYNGLFYCISGETPACVLSTRYTESPAYWLFNPSVRELDLGSVDVLVNHGIRGIDPKPGEVFDKNIHRKLDIPGDDTAASV